MWIKWAQKATAKFSIGWAWPSSAHFLNLGTPSATVECSQWWQLWSVQQKVCITNHGPLFLKKQTKYRPFLLKLQTKSWNATAKSVKLRKGILCWKWLFKVFTLTPLEWILTQFTNRTYKQGGANTLNSIWMMARLKKHLGSPKILTLWKNTDHFNHNSEKVCITDQNYLYRPRFHRCSRINSRLLNTKSAWKTVFAI